MKYRSNHYEIMTPKTMLKIFVTLKKTQKSRRKIFTKETTVIITLKYFPLLLKGTVITLKILNHTGNILVLLISCPMIFSVTLDFQRRDFQCNSFILNSPREFMKINFARTRFLL